MRPCVSLDIKWISDLLSLVYCYDSMSIQSSLLIPSVSGALCIIITPSGRNYLQMSRAFCLGEPTCLPGNTYYIYKLLKPWLLTIKLHLNQTEDASITVKSLQHNETVKQFERITILHCILGRETCLFCGSDKMIEVQIDDGIEWKYRESHHCTNDRNKYHILEIINIIVALSHHIQYGPKCSEVHCIDKIYLGTSSTQNRSPPVHFYSPSLCRSL